MKNILQFTTNESKNKVHSHTSSKREHFIYESVVFWRAKSFSVNLVKVKTRRELRCQIWKKINKNKTKHNSLKAFLLPQWLLSSWHASSRLTSILLMNYSHTVQSQWNITNWTFNITLSNYYLDCSINPLSAPQHHLTLIHQLTWHSL